MDDGSEGPNAWSASSEDDPTYKSGSPPSTAPPRSSVFILGQAAPTQACKHLMCPGAGVSHLPAESRPPRTF